MTSVASTQKVCGQVNILDEWLGLPKMKQRKPAASMCMVGGPGQHLGCGCKSGTSHTGKCVCMKAGLKCNSK